ncbi:hypothetical protein K8354_02700 [Polaribacter litorisediminis]|uniref:hypothetical protein n=1 Tax=Polaribacter litorisediminis TaxID=1908341 RepID=UPI001CC0D202|nr:hypothetical protein [Polaribacter litorisediminis]UAM98752.1 hypothetical protein K8354_02700 [Polaribacter litorisediminis]
MAYIIDEAKDISIINLRKWKYLKPYTYKTGTVSWNRNGMKTSTMSIIVQMQKDKGVLILDYKCNGTKYNYNIQIISKPSNLGKGNVFYFICPFTFKTCRKLNLYNERFIHRSAIKDGMYSKQIESKKYRHIDRVYGSYFKSAKYFEILYSKNFKRSYDGKPTKKYLKLMAKINEGKSFSAEDIESLLLFGV